MLSATLAHDSQDVKTLLIAPNRLREPGDADPPQKAGNRQDLECESLFSKV